MNGKEKGWGEGRCRGRIWKGGEELEEGMRDFISNRLDHKKTIDSKGSRSVLLGR